MGDSRDLLGVREAADRLGVHENTVRNWVERGMLTPVRLPGSGYMKFEPAEVDRVLRLQKPAASPVEPHRQLVGPELVDASQLSEWAKTRDAQDKFPELIRRLLAADPGVTNISMRAGDGVSVPGWDGVADASGASFLPDGRLCFELGVGARPKSKADKDFEKRSVDPAGVDPQRCTFVFMTPRRWHGAKDWESDRRRESAFADVRVLDADDLEGWLHATPAVHYWVSEQLGRRPREAETLEQWWARFREQTEPPLPPDLFLAGRSVERDQLREVLSGPADVLGVQARWQDEALAFVSAAIAESVPDGAITEQPSLVIYSREVWESVAPEPGKATLIALFDDPPIETALQHNHHVILPAGQDQTTRRRALELRRVDRQEASAALSAAGIDHDKSYQLSALARRSMPSLIRELARNPFSVRPAWARPPAASQFAPLVLVGRWTPSDSDTSVVASIADAEWSDVERLITEWTTAEDPPVVQSGSQWHMASPEEATRLLASAITSGTLEQWYELLLQVLLELDPRLDLPDDERVMASIRGATREYSASLRKGMADGVALMGTVVEDEVLSDSLTGNAHARRAVHALLDAAGQDPSGRTWQSLADVLPLLAEAAPEVFLEAIHNDLDREAPLLVHMFQDAGQGSPLSVSSPHSNLLWALETLCWAPEYLLDASRALAKLAQLDPDGRLANRPIRSLENVFVGWIRHTSAPLAVRQKALDAICREVPDQGWLLLLGIWPSDHAVSMPPASPRYRDWKPDEQSVAVSEMLEFVRGLLPLALQLADTDEERWTELIERLHPLPPDERERLVSRLEALHETGEVDNSDRLVLWQGLREYIARHRRFQDAKWSLDTATLDRLERLADSLEPDSRVSRFAYLFDWHPELSGVNQRDYDAYQVKLDELRMQAVDALLAQPGARLVEELEDMASRVAVPDQLGWSLGAAENDVAESVLLGWLDADDSSKNQVASGWARRRAGQAGLDWLRKTFTAPEVTTQSQRLALVLEAPPSSQLWGWLDEQGSDLAASYWTRTNPGRVPPEDVEQAVQAFIAHGRPWAAIRLLARTTHDRDGRSADEVMSRLIHQALESATTSTELNEAISSSAGYEIGQLLDYLEEAGEDAATLARFEFAFLRLLEHYRPPRALQRAIQEDPALFVDLVSRVYRAKHDEPRTLDEHEAALAHHAWWVLHEWPVVPGTREDGSIVREHLRSWVREARLSLTDIDRADVGDEQLGQWLARSPIGSDGAWPAEPIRDLVEDLGSSHLESGLVVGAINKVGVTVRSPYAGGEQERERAAQYRSWAGELSGDWPRTSRALRKIAESFEQDALREDREAEMRSDTA